jgi:hypothetical protein
VFPLIDGEAVIKLAPIDDRSSIVFIFCMSIAAPAVVSVCLVSLNSTVKNLLFEAYHLVWLLLLMSLHADHFADIPVMAYHHLSIFIICAFMKPPVLRPVLEFALHPIFHLLSHPHVHTRAGALPEGIDTESEAISGFQHSSCTSSPLLAALWTLLAGKKCRCHVQVFDLLLMAIFSVAVSGAFTVFIALNALFGAASWPMFLYPVGGLLIAILLGAPYVILNLMGGVRLRKTPLCASGPIPFAGIAMYLIPMLMCAWIAPIVFWLCTSLYSPPQPVHELMLVALSSVPPYVFVRARPHAFRPLGWLLFLVFYFWSNLMLTNFFGAPTDFLYSSDAIRLSLVFFIPLYAFLQTLLSRYAPCLVFFLSLLCLQSFLGMRPTTRLSNRSLKFLQRLRMEQITFQTSLLIPKLQHHTGRRRQPLARRQCSRTSRNVHNNVHVVERATQLASAAAFMLATNLVSLTLAWILAHIDDTSVQLGIVRVYW